MASHAGNTGSNPVRGTSHGPRSRGGRSRSGPVVGIDHVQVAAPAGCEEQARAFYGGLLGLPEIEKPPALAARGGCWFACGRQQLHVGVSDPFTPATKAHPALALRDAEALAVLLARLGAAGYEARRDVELPGLERGFVDDPFGNRIELVALVA